MALEDEPAFGNWVTALDNLVEAKKRLLDAIHADRPEQELIEARRSVTLARDRYCSADYEFGYA